MSTTIKDLLWTERYRPTTLDQLALDEENRRLLDEYMGAGEIPHMLLVGPPGSGKTTVARILINALDCTHITLNASAERGIDTVREKIGAFATSMFGGHFNIVFLDEADAMTADAQTALRNLMESYSERTRFILTANYGNKIIAPIQSRCQVLMFGRPPLKERFRILSTILNEEGIVAAPPVVLSYAEKYPDLRQMLYAAQRAFLGSKDKVLPVATAAVGAGGAEMLDALKRKDWALFKRAASTSEFDAQQALRELFHAIPDDHPRVGFLRHIIGRGVHETGFTPDPVILFLAVAAEAMEGI